MIVAVGSSSKNPVKLNAVEAAFIDIWPDREHQVVGAKVESGVNDQPMSDDESLQGAHNRAHRAMEAVKGAKYGVGIEGGLHKTGSQWFERSWIVVCDHSGNEGVGTTVSFLIPPAMASELVAGRNLSDVTDEFFNVKNIGQAQGFFGLMSNDRITRTTGYRDAVIAALSSFIHPKLFGRK